MRVVISSCLYQTSHLKSVNLIAIVRYAGVNFSYLSDLFYLTCGVHLMLFLLICVSLSSRFLSFCWKLPACMWVIYSRGFVKQ